MNLTRRAFLKGSSSALAINAFSGAMRFDSRAVTPSTGKPSDDLCFTNARELARLIRSGKLSAREVMAAHLRQIGRLNPKLNAIVAKADVKARFFVQGLEVAGGSPEARPISP